jgi:translation initiation factor eIF-2B subunit delta
VLSTADVDRELSGIVADTRSGATALTLRAVGLLAAVAADRTRLEQTARLVVRAQPSMAGFQTAAAIAIASPDPARALTELADRVRRGSRSIARVAAPLISLRSSANPILKIVTLSRSAIVEHALDILSTAESLAVSCAESLPGGEGRSLAEALAVKGIRTALFSDAGIGTALIDADALVLGADAVSSRGFINKVGSAAMVALARERGVPVFVLAGREKVVPAGAYDSLELGQGPAAEIAVESPVTVRNPYFERVVAQPGDQVCLDTVAVGFPEVEAAGLWSETVCECYMRMLCA